MRSSGRIGISFYLQIISSMQPRLWKFSRNTNSNNVKSYKNWRNTRPPSKKRKKCGCRCCRNFTTQLGGARRQKLVERI